MQDVSATERLRSKQLTIGIFEPNRTMGETYRSIDILRNNPNVRVFQHIVPALSFIEEFDKRRKPDAFIIGWGSKLNSNELEGIMHMLTRLRAIQVASQNTPSENPFSVFVIGSDPVNIRALIESRLSEEEKPFNLTIIPKDEALTQLDERLGTLSASR